MSHAAGEPAHRRLKPSLVPEPLWELSAYRVLPRRIWQRIRAETISEARGLCTVCGGAGQPMFCHEEWAYDDAQGMAVLACFALICPECNAVHHFGRLGQVTRLTRVVAHVESVNEIEKLDAERLFTDATAEWRRRSSRPWSVAVAPDLLDRYPELGALDGARGRPGEGRARVLARERGGS